VTTPTPVPPLTDPEAASVEFEGRILSKLCRQVLHSGAGQWYLGGSRIVQNSGQRMEVWVGPLISYFLSSDRVLPSFLKL
jgi:hypothetical protein